MNTIEIYRNESTPTNTVDPVVFTEIKPDENSVQVKKVMGENQVNITFEDSRYLQFKINDFCTIYGEVYKLAALPILTKLSTLNYRYTMLMQSQGYDLSKAQYLFLGATNELRESDFSLMGNADTFMDLLIENANRVEPGAWQKGEVVAGTEYKNLTFSKENCYNVLSRLAEEFETEFTIIGKTVHLVKKVKDLNIIYRHGRNKGLYEITRKNLNETGLVTRLYAFGAEKNLPPEYLAYSRRLRFPGGYNPCLISALTATVVDNLDGTTTYTFNWTAPISSGVSGIAIQYRGFVVRGPLLEDMGPASTPRSITIPNGDYEFSFRTYGSQCYTTIPGTGVATPFVHITADIVVPIFVYEPLPYVERSTAIYGVIEHTEIFEDIYPHRTGTVSAVNGLDEFVFTDADIDFNVNDYLLPGLDAKVTFNTGQLAGYSFKITSFNNTTKEFRILRNEDDRVLQLPTSGIRPEIGDQYVLVDIKMPQSYIDAAEAALLAKANALLLQLSEPQLSYTVVIDPATMKRLGRVLRLSDLIWIEDSELELQKKIRVVSITRNIVDENLYQIELSDIVSPGTISRLVSAQSSTDRDVRDINTQLLNNSILNNNVIGTLTFPSMPSTATTVGFLPVYLEVATGKLYKKI